jgi:hypothetical protein
MWHLDGAVVQNMALGAPQLSLNPPAESLQEFRAEVSDYSAEFGRSGNGTIIMTTRSGTNELHGAAYEFLRNDKLDARTFFAVNKAPLRYNIFGGSVGGPVKPAEVNGDFLARKDVTLIDPLTKQPFAGNIIPTSRCRAAGSSSRLTTSDPYPCVNRVNPCPDVEWKKDNS